MPDNPRTRALKIAGAYFLLAAVYIVGSDLWFYSEDPEINFLVMAGMAKGLGFVTVTAVLLYLVIHHHLRVMRRDLEREAAAERALRQSSDELATAQRIANLGSWEVDVATGKLQWSEEVYRIFGVSRASFEPTPDSMRALVHVDDREHLTGVREQWPGHGQLDYEHRIVRPDGEVRYVNVRVEMVQDPEGRPQRLFGTVQDVTDRKASQLELERRTRQQAAIAELGLVALAQPDPRQIMERAMDAAARTLEVEYAKVLMRLPEGSLRLVAGVGWRPGTVGQALVEPGAGSQAGFSIDATEPVVVEDLRTEQRFSGPPLLREHGVVSGISTTIRAQDGVWGVLGVHTTRRRAFNESDVLFVQTLANLIGNVIQQADAREVVRERNFLRQVGAEAAALGGWTVNLEDNAVTWSPELARIFETPADYQPDFDEDLRFYPPDHGERLMRAFEACASDGTPYDLELPAITLKGRSIWIRAIGQAQRGEDGKVREVRGAVQDISDRKRLESMLHQAQRLEAVGKLTGGIAHDFNNLLTVIVGTADLIIDATDEGSQMNSLAHTTRQAAQRGAELTRHLLAYARKQPLEPQPTHVGELLSSMDHLLRRTLGEHIEIETIHGGGLWTALVDPAQLESAVLNMCLNARDAMPDGGRLTLETANVHLDQDYARRHLEVSPGQYVMIAVSDTGHGMEPAIADRVFEPFFTTKEVGQGTGLGLSMVYGFVKQSRGHIKLYTEPGRGTTLKVYLPRARGAGSEPDQSPAETRNLPGAGERVLVVEDDDLVRQFVADQVTTLGYRAITAGDAAEALRVLETHDVDLLFTDVVMPGEMDGRALADAVRRRHPELPVLFTSGYTENAIVHQGRLDPGTHLLNKPYRIADLATKLRLALEQKPR